MDPPLRDLDKRMREGKGEARGDPDLFKSVVTCTETGSAGRGPGLGSSLRFVLGHVNFEENAELSKR